MTDAIMPLIPSSVLWPSKCPRLTTPDPDRSNIHYTGTLSIVLKRMVCLENICHVLILPNYVSNLLFNNSILCAINILKKT